MAIARLPPGALSEPHARIFADCAPGAHKNQKLAVHDEVPVGIAKRSALLDDGAADK
jgi:hypothetical protein